jgi:ParB family chromosome partitioning protein
MPKDCQAKLEISYLPIATLIPNPHNARTHSGRQIEQIAKSLKQFGFLNPILIDRNRIIVAGHGRVAAAKKLDFVEVPTIRIEGLTEEQIRAYILADNKIGLNAG